MTTVVAWAAYDNRGPTSVYMASDSRISWNGNTAWDYARKVFSCSNFPDLIAYVGEVLFTVQVISQWVSLSDSGEVFERDSSPEQRFESLCTLVKRSFASYPKPLAQDNFSIVFCSLNQTRNIFVGKLNRKDSQWSIEHPKIPNKSDLILVEGSGKSSFTGIYSKFEKSEIGRTSRAVYSAFCIHVEKGLDKSTGAPPQLAAIYKKGISKPLGVVWKGKSYIFGIEVSDSERLGISDWRNYCFELCDARTLKIKVGAQRQPIPKGLELEKFGLVKDSL
ncbi:hypothetical protein [Pseudomonas sp. XWY-1]|uniref:hypothetical protein n=1 Tax=Pseudomonas TaxID=286 RepID=UPI001299C763|nr:hypothetical protein [Pseudomonas sp. XWY-1]MRF39374.1 hypothetical protein [Escherichia coli]